MGETEAPDWASLFRNLINSEQLIKIVLFSGEREVHHRWFRGRNSPVLPEIHRRGEKNSPATVRPIRMKEE